MPHDDEHDDFSHLPTVDGLASEADKQKLWKQQSRRSQAEPRPEPTNEEQFLPQEHLEEPATAEGKPEAPHSHAVEETAEAWQPPPSRVPDWAKEALSGSKQPAARRELHIAGGAPAAKAGAESPPLVEKRKMPAEARPPSPDKSAGSSVPDWVKEAFGDASAKKPASTPGASLSKKEAESRSKSQEPPASPAAKESALPAKSREQPGAHASAKHRDKEDAAEKGGSGSEPSKEASAKEKEAEAETGHHPPHLPHDEPRPLTRKEKLKLLYEKWGGKSLMWSVGLHLVLLIIAAVIVVQQTMEEEIDFLPGGSAAAKEASAQMEHQVQRKKLKKTLTQNLQLKRVVSISQNAALSLPEAPPDMFDLPNEGLLSARDITRGMGSGGMGGGLGKGLGMGGKITFLGNTATGRHIIFVVDVSASMSSLSSTSNGGRRISRFDLLKEELNKSLSRLPAGTAYQVIYFSDFAWPHNELDTHNLKAFDKYQWEITPKNINVRIPSFRYLKADMLTILRSRDVINASDNPGGTNWGSGLLMALKGVPKPDFIFFMTDGNRADAEGWLDAVTNFNLRTGRKTIIHTTAMMEPDAARELDDLAKRNGGNFTIVNADGSITTSKDYFGQ